MAGNSKDEILFQEPGITIAYSPVAHTLAPYPPSPRDDSINFGFVDLRDRPDLVAEIPEVREAPGLHAILVALNQSGTRLTSLGCGCGLPLKRESASPPTSIKSYTTVAFL